MYQLELVDVAEPRLDLARRRAQDAARLGRAVVDQAARNLAAPVIDAAYGLAALELPPHVRHADRQQTLALSGERLHRTGVERQGAAHLQVVGQPLLARRERGAL